MACEVVHGSSAQWERVEAQRRKGLRMLLGCPKCTANEAMYGDLGLLPLKALADLRKLRYLHKLVGLPKEEWPAKIFALGKTEGRWNWWCHVRRLLGKSGYAIRDAVPAAGALLGDPEDWATEVREAVTAKCWEKHQQQREGMTTLRLYSELKIAPGFEQYLNDHHHSSVIFRLRADRYQLGAMLVKMGGIPPDLADLMGGEGECPFAILHSECSDVWEDTEHFLLQCPALEEDRRRLMSEIAKALTPKRAKDLGSDLATRFESLNSEAKIRALLGGPISWDATEIGSPPGEEPVLSEKRERKFRKAAATFIVEMGRARSTLLHLAKQPSGGNGRSIPGHGSIALSALAQDDELPN